MTSRSILPGKRGTISGKTNDDEQEEDNKFDNKRNTPVPTAGQEVEILERITRLPYKITRTRRTITSRLQLPGKRRKTWETITILPRKIKTMKRMRRMWITKITR